MKKIATTPPVVGDNMTVNVSDEIVFVDNNMNSFVYPYNKY